MCTQIVVDLFEAQGSHIVGEHVVIYPIGIGAKNERLSAIETAEQQVISCPKASTLW